MNAVIEQLIRTRIAQIENALSWSAPRLARAQRIADDHAKDLATAEAQHQALVTELEELTAQLPEGTQVPSPGPEPEAVEDGEQVPTQPPPGIPDQAGGE